MVEPRTRYDEEYTPSDETIRFFIWFNTYFKEDNKSAEGHYQLIDHINKKWQFKGVECTRGLGKSTLIDIYLILYWIFIGRKPNFGQVNYILLIMDTVSQASANFEQILMILEDNEALKKHLHVVKSRLGDDPTIYIYNKDLGRTMYLKARGSGQKMRGTRIGGKRPNIIILDDIENDENVESKEARDKLANWFFKAVIPAVDPNRFELIFIGTPLHMDALLLKLKGNDSWHFINLPVAEELTTKMIEEKSHIISVWSDRFTPEYLKTVYNMYKDANRLGSFWQEYMLELTPKEDLLFNINKIHRYDDGIIKEHLPELTYYISVDLAISDKANADYTVLVVIGVNDNNDWFLIDGFMERGIKPDETIDRIFKYVKMYRPYTVVLEKVAFQTSMKTFIEREMMLRNIFFSVDMVSRPNNKNSKLSVIKALQPIVNMGKFWIPDKYLGDMTDELIGEMQLITNDKILAKHDDVIDAIAQLTLISILVQTPVRKIESQYLDVPKNSYYL